MNLNPHRYRRRTTTLGAEITYGAFPIRTSNPQIIGYRRDDVLATNIDHLPLKQVIGEERANDMISEHLRKQPLLYADTRRAARHELFASKDVPGHNDYTGASILHSFFLGFIAGLIGAVAYTIAGVAGIVELSPWFIPGNLIFMAATAGTYMFIRHRRHRQALAELVDAERQTHALLDTPIDYIETTSGGHVHTALYKLSRNLRELHHRIHNHDMGPGHYHDLEKLWSSYEKLTETMTTLAATTDEDEQRREDAAIINAALKIQARLCALTTIFDDYDDAARSAHNDIQRREAEHALDDLHRHLKENLS